MGIDKSNPFSRSGDEVELFRHYGSGGRSIKIQSPDDGVVEGTSGTVQQGLEDSHFEQESDKNID